MAIQFLPLVLKWGPLVLTAAGFIRDTFFGKKEEKEEQKQKEKVVVREVIKAPPVDVRNAQLEEIQRVNKILSDYKNTALRQAETTENRLVESYKSYIDKLVNSLDKSIDTDKLRRLNNRVKHQLSGCIANVISRNLSIDNVKCEQILKTPEPSYRGTLMQEFISDMNKDALGKAKDILIESLQDSASDIAQILRDKVSSEEAKLKSNLDYLQDFKNSHNLDSKEQKQIALSYEIYLDSNARETLKSFNLN